MEPGPFIYKSIQHLNIPNAAHALTFSCFKRKPFLKSERACVFLAEAVLQARLKHQFHVWAYVFMPEHVHLLIWRTDKSSSIPEILRGIKQSAARRALIYLRKYNPVGLTALATGQTDAPYRFWLDGGGYDQVMDTVPAAHAMAEYIHANPVRRGLCAFPEDWRWSSAAEWAGHGAGAVSLDREFFPTR